ncbi:hypothetical protein NVI2019_PEGOAJLN_02304 [Providencia alcalifaciens]|jgi:hypothetical protein|uniref:Uncharacterized protein n=1 Tax=Providencia alcalifaciens TaxID=126385 RepID=A0A4R3NPE8_9GAMM|nr:hypothetical protein EC835_102286 [Providencia alcalifaciens]CAG9415580.1 hypothetical protein NVI2019_PLFLNFOB_01291 [Providencia alcalifaciens]CAG9421410.1 hypothetical protein NVI2019_OHEONHNH_02030 [Providencia alcalifaciens]CAG9423796.1 hypothetical protein NVI2019_GHJFPKLH_02326 [Providencia alcalifaciens]CAG9423945.1 hypothetical protein NVI2019_PEGOAJLN_02304 [Providencia alcalifaciens]
MGTLFTISFVSVLVVSAVIDTVIQRGKQDND